MAYVYPFANADEQSKLQVWQKGRAISNYPSSVWRWDAYGAVMKYDEHGNTDSEHGWEIDHIYPASKGGSDRLSNLQPLHWQNNRSKADSVS